MYEKEDATALPYIAVSAKVEVCLGKKMISFNGSAKTKIRIALCVDVRTNKTVLEH